MDTVGHGQNIHKKVFRSVMKRETNKKTSLAGSWRNLKKYNYKYIYKYKKKYCQKHNITNKKHQEK